MFRFLLSRRWIGFAIFVMLLATVCTRLGFWQIHRLQHRLAQNEIITKHFKADPVSLGSVIEADTEVDRENEWTRVRATGTYDLDHQVTVKFTTRNGAPGVDVVTPLVLGPGEAILIDRGWLQTTNTMDRPDVPSPPSGEVTVTGWLRQNSTADGQAIRPVDGQVRAISAEGMASYVPYRLLDGYLNLRSQDPEAATPLAAEPDPDLGQGPHFFYALQWWFFALLAVVGWFWFAWAEAKERRNAR